MTTKIVCDNCGSDTTVEQIIELHYPVETELTKAIIHEEIDFCSIACLMESLSGR